MFEANVTDVKVTTEIDKDSNRLKAKISFDCVTNPDNLMELDLLRIKGVPLKATIFTKQVEFGKKPDVPVVETSEPKDELWNAGDNPDAPKNLLNSGDSQGEAKSEPKKRGRPAKKAAAQVPVEKVDIPQEPALT